MASHTPTHSQKTNKRLPKFDDPVLGLVPIIHIETIPLKTYLMMPFTSFEESKVLSDLRFIRTRDNVSVYKLA